MCLILVAWRVHPDYPLLVAANRDEFFARPSAPAGFWEEAPTVCAGRDLEAGGSWLGISSERRFAALTNYRDGLKARPGAPSRGTLVASFLTGALSPDEYLSALVARAPAYHGFNLLVGDGERLGYFSNRAPEESGYCWLEPGIYGLSNHLLDTPWPKLSTAKTAFSAALERLPQTDDFFTLLTDDEIFPDAMLPSTGVPAQWERVLSAIFVRTPDYGTRASTVLSVHGHGEITLTERSFGPNATPLGEVRETFQSSEISTGV